MELTQRLCKVLRKLYIDINTTPYVIVSSNGGRYEIY